MVGWCVCGGCRGGEGEAWRCGFGGEVGEEVVYFGAHVFWIGKVEENLELGLFENLLDEAMQRRFAPMLTC